MDKLEVSRFFFALTFKDYGLWQGQEVDYSLIPLSFTGKQMGDILRRVKLSNYVGWEKFCHDKYNRKVMVEICGKGLPDEIVEATIAVLLEYQSEFDRWKNAQAKLIIRRKEPRDGDLI